MTITVEDKLQCAVRELGFRRRVYERRVAQGKMTQAMADREIKLMEAIAQDYRAITQCDPGLFDGDAAA